ncbi:tRNA preQ1(34) S-adenosylmethionine ribosyltransferase-isomerase QueA [Treponema sp. OMZ 840]|uniref:tRNA preQ1(34) S-adenosylmethionine ribosyltransferase-isomerase QueA n=1 Tax=Treponema sp. OMZ 840 TaxID=244313 RepID=UPI003D93093D
MLTKDFYFNLPEDLIAQYPSSVRGEDKLMVLNKTDGNLAHYMIEDLPDLMEKDSLMVFNNSKVRPSRCFAVKLDSASSKPAEFLLIEKIGEHAEQTHAELSKHCGNGEPKELWRAMVKNAKKHRPGSRYRFQDGTVGSIVDFAADEGTEFRTLVFVRSQLGGMHKKNVSSDEVLLDENWFERNGHMPLPPYIKRADTAEDSSRYQNVYAAISGSIACPTAGLHFTDRILERLKAKGIRMANLTLHVGLGTFLPVRTENIEDHVMHSEVYTVSEQTAFEVNSAKRDGRPITAVGTTAVRTLESAWKNGRLCSGTSSTDIFLYPGCTFNVVDRLITNFHTPESTLLMLVSAFAGREHILHAYEQAVKSRYRFFSYGDAMFIR